MMSEMPGPLVLEINDHIYEIMILPKEGRTTVRCTRCGAHLVVPQTNLEEIRRLLERHPACFSLFLRPKASLREKRKGCCGERR